MEKIIKKRDKIHFKLKKYQHKIHDLEYQLIELEREANEIDQKDIIKQMKITRSSKVIVIGDSLWHDIAGGNEMGFDGLWIKNGVHRPQLNKKKEIQLLLDAYKPKYSIKELKL